MFNVNGGNFRVFVQNGGSFQGANVNQKWEPTRFAFSITEDGDVIYETLEELKSSGIACESVYVWYDGGSGWVRDELHPIDEVPEKYL